MDFIICCDRSYDSSSNAGGWGMIIFDALGLFYYSNKGYFSECSNAKEAELESPQHFIIYASANKISNMLLVSDCLNIVNFIKGKKDCTLWNYQLATHLSCAIL